MKRKNRLIIQKSTAVVMALLLFCNITVLAEGLSEESSSLIQTSILLADTDLETNAETIKLLIDQCLAQLQEDDPVAGTLQSIRILLNTGTADAMSITTLLKSVIDEQNEIARNTAQNAESRTDSFMTSESDTSASETEVSESGLPVYETENYIKTILSRPILVDVPGDWGNNASGRSMTSYSSENDSGAISPSAGTLNLGYFQMETDSAETAFQIYEKNLDDMSVTVGLVSCDVTVADLPARKLDFIMQVGANQYICETVCFAHENTMYTIEMMQGQQTSYDYFPMYYQVVDSTEVGNEQEIAEAEMLQAGLDAEDNVSSDIPNAPDDIGNSETVDEPGAVNNSEAVDGLSQNETEDLTEEFLAADMGEFLYELNGHIYQFPTAVRNLDSGDIPLERDRILAYDFSSDADMAGGRWTEIVNTQCVYYENALYREMVGITNMNGYPAPISEGILTILSDTRGSQIDISLPGNIRVGGSESDILYGFPEFNGMNMDGYAKFRGNELCYACNVRNDGCNGYVIIRNDAPFYSALSIICEEGKIIEITFECIGSDRAKDVFM